MTRRLVAISMAILALAATAGASVQKGDTELEFLAGWLSQSGGTEGGDLDAWFVSGALNYFVSDNISLGIGGFGSEVDLSGTTTTIQLDTGVVPLNAFFRDVEQDVTLYGVGANVKLHFGPTNRWVPYVGGQVKWVSAKVDTTGEYVAETGVPGELSEPQPFSESTDLDGFLFGPLAGLRIELNEYNDFFVEGQYHLWSGDIADLLDNGFGVFVGIVHQFQ